MLIGNISLRKKKWSFEPRCGPERRHAPSGGREGAEAPGEPEEVAREPATTPRTRGAHSISDILFGVGRI
ncbi:unnamed protein product [Leptidea sinapis]|uniref:Uncharacterized protein n=1 Tax=Leptidea sinapis TaxID=189913 RepID=A0A5E4PVS8_9NEOP|nr:unnamed protein product [Leptidea sinapis]